MSIVIRSLGALAGQDGGIQEPPPGVLEQLQAQLDGMSQNAPLAAVVTRIAIAVAALIVAALIASFVRSFVRGLLSKTKLMPSMVKLFSSLAYFGVWAVAILTALAMLGIPITGIAAALGALGLVLGLALQESIGNFAATVNFMMFEPFKVGDLIESGDTLGVVTEIQPLSTVITKYDNKVVTIPNGRLQSDKIINYSHMGILRADQLFQISYSDDLLHALAVLQEIVDADERILKDPPPAINVRELGASGVTLACLPYVNFENFWPIQAELRKQVKLRFDQEGITIPFPQRSVHVESVPSGNGHYSGAAPSGEGQARGD